MDDLLGFGSSAPAARPSTSSTADLADLFSGAAITPAAPSPASGFTFIAGVAPGSPPAPAPASGFAFLSGSGATAPAPATFSALDSALAAAGYGGTGNAQLPAAATGGGTPSAAASADVGTWSGAALKRFLDERRIDHRGVTEKSDLVALVRRAMGGAAAAAAPPAPVAASRNEWRSSGPASALSVGMPNAFEVHGLSHVAGAAAISAEQQRQYDRAASAGALAAGASGSTDVASFFAAARRLPLAQMVVPTAPSTRLRVRIPAVAINPTLREVTASHFYECATELSASSAVLAATAIGSAASGSGAGAAPAGSASALDSLTPAQRALLPHLGCTLVGPLRYFEAQLRGDVSDADVLHHFASAGRDIGLEPTHVTARSAVLQQRISVPASAFSTFLTSPAVVGTAASGSQRFPVVVGPPPAGAAADASGAAAAISSAATWLYDAIGGSRLYVNSVCVYIGAGPAGDRIAAIASARYLPPAPSTSAPSAAPGAAPGATTGIAAAAATTGGASMGGRVLFKDRVGGTVLGVASGTTVDGTPVKPTPVATKKAGSSTASIMLSELMSTGGGIVCVVANKLAPPRYSFRIDRAVGGSAAATSAAASPGAAKASGGPAAPASDDLFGLMGMYGAPGAASGGDDGGRAQAVAHAVALRQKMSPAEAAVALVPRMPPSLSTYAPGVRALAALHSAPPGTAPAPAAKLVTSNARALADGDWAEVGGADSTWSVDFDDGAAILEPQPTTQAYHSDAALVAASHEWSRLRVAFLDMDISAGAPAAAPAPAAGGGRAATTTTAAELASLVGGPQTPGAAKAATSFDLSRIADELVALTCELVAAVRGRPALAESVWVDAIAHAKRAAAEARGETLTGAAVADSWTAVVGGSSSGSGSTPSALLSTTTATAAAPGAKGSAASSAAATASNAAAHRALAADVFAAHDAAAPAPVRRVDDLFHLLGGASPSSSAQPAASAPAPAPAATAAPAAAPAPGYSTVAPMLDKPVAATLAPAPASSGAGGTLPAAGGGTPLTPSSVSAVRVTVGQHSTPFVLHADTCTAVTALHRLRGEQRLFAAAAPFEARAKVEEWLATQVMRLVGATYTLHKMAMPPLLPLPRLDQLPLPPMPSEMRYTVAEDGTVAMGDGEGDDDDAGGEVTEGLLRMYAASPRLEAAAAACSTSVEGPAASRPGIVAPPGSSGGTSAVMILPPAPDGITATDETLREVYHRAYGVVRCMRRHEVLALCTTQHDVDVEMARRLLRKKTHVGMRVAAAFYHAATVLSHLAATTATSAAATDAGRAIVSSIFGFAGEAAVLHVMATAGAQLGDLIATPHRLLFHANILGMRTKRNLPWDSIIAIHASTSFLRNNAITLTYVDDEKVAAKAKAATAAAARPSIGTSALPAPATGSAGADLFASMTVGPPAPPAAPAGAVSVADAFNVMCEIDVGAPAPPPAAAPASASTGGGGIARDRGASAGTAAAASATAGSGGSAVLEGLSQADLMVFLGSGGAPDTLSQLTIVPAAADRDALYYTLHMLRQMDTRPHERTFTAGIIGGPHAASAAAAASVRLELPDMHAYAVGRWDGTGAKPTLPLLLDRTALAAHTAANGGAAASAGMSGRGGRGGKPAAAAAATASLLDDAAVLFATAPIASTAAAAPAAAPAADIYADLADTLAADSL